MESLGNLTRKLEKNIFETLSQNPHLASLEESAVEELYNHPRIQKFTSLIEHYRGIDGTREHFETLLENALDRFVDGGLLHEAKILRASR